jgi:hypothetical protein
MAAASGDGADFVDEEGGLFPCGEVTAAVRFVPVHDVGEAALGLAAGGSRYFFAEDAASGRDRDGMRVAVPPTASLLAVRTPMEIEFAPSRSRFAFTLHAVVSEHGVTQPSDLWMVGGDADPVQLTDGPWADTHPLWSPDGSQLACISDRGLAGHHLPYTMVTGEEPVLAASFPGSAEQLAWSQDGHRLLVLAADPGSYSREVSGTFVTGGASELERGIRRSSGAWRRLLMVDLTTGVVTEVGPPGWSVWEVGWDGAGGTAVALIAENRPAAAGTGRGWPASISRPGQRTSCTSPGGSSRGSPCHRMDGTPR